MITDFPHVITHAVLKHMQFSLYLGIHLVGWLGRREFGRLGSQWFCGGVVGVRVMVGGRMGRVHEFKAQSQP